MNAKELVKGKTYRYTQGVYPIEIVYLDGVFNKYVFRNYWSKVERTLTYLTVLKFVEEINSDKNGRF